ncbi:MAG: hypothetical protein AAF514_17640, partial [Verrucomicrobiota bacterium]
RGRPEAGTANLYYCFSKRLTGPYSARKFAARFCGGGIPFQDKAGRWWTTAFQNGDFEPDRERGQKKCEREGSWTINEPGLTLVPLEVELLPGGDLEIRAKASGYERPGSEEAQEFNEGRGELRARDESR